MPDSLSPRPPRRVALAARRCSGCTTAPTPADWGRIRAAQLHAGAPARAVPARRQPDRRGDRSSLLLAHASCRSWLLGGWGALIAAIAAAVAVPPPARRTTATTAMPRLRDVRDTVLEGIALGAVWSVAAARRSARTPTPAPRSGCGLVLSVLMTAAAVAMAPLPLATLTFLGDARRRDRGACWSLDGALCRRRRRSSLFTALLMIGCFGRARALVVDPRQPRSRSPNATRPSACCCASSRKSGADWLWETDAARRVVRASAALRLSPAGSIRSRSTACRSSRCWPARPGRAGNFAAGLRTLADKLKARESFRDLLLPVYDRRRGALVGAVRQSPRYDERGALHAASAASARTSPNSARRPTRSTAWRGSTR